MRGRIPVGVLAGAALVVALGAAGAIWAVGRGSSAGDTAKFVPANAAVYMTLNTDATSRQWVQMSQLLDRMGLDDPLRSARDDGASAADLKWEEDVAPFLGGEATVAAIEQAGEFPGILVILSVRDGARAWDRAIRTLDEQARKSGTATDTTTYRDTTVRTYKTDGSDAPSISIARKDTYLVAATTIDLLKASLDLQSGSGESLASKEKFRTARSSVADDVLLFSYVDLAAAGRLGEEVAAGLVPGAGAVDGSLKPAGLDNAVVAFSVSAERTGIRAEYQLVGADKSVYPIVATAAGDDSRLAARAPNNSLVYLYGADLYNGVFKAARDTAAKLNRDPQAGGFLGDVQEQIDAVSRELGFDIERDFFANLTGEFAFAFGTRSTSFDDAWGLGMSVVKDAGAVGRSLDKLNEYAGREGLRVGSSTVSGVKITELRETRGDAPAVAYALAGDELIAGIGADAVRGAIEKRDSLAGTTDFKDAIKTLPGNRALTLFVNVREAVTLAREDSRGAADEILDSRALSSMRWFAMAMTRKDDRIGSVMFLRIDGE